MMGADLINGVTAGDAASTVAGGGGLLGAIWWFLKGAHKRIDEVQDKIEKSRNDFNMAIEATNLSLSTHKVYSEGTFAKSSSIDRVHQRIDEMSKKTDAIYQLLVTRSKK